MWNGSGVFEPPVGEEFPAVPDELIRAAYYNAVIEALCAGFSNTLPRDGQAPATGNIDLGDTYRVINMAAAAAPGQAVRFNEFNALQSQVNGLGSGVEPFVYFAAGII